jgi:hypothetical protein
MECEGGDMKRYSLWGYGKEQELGGYVSFNDHVKDVTALKVRVRELGERRMETVTMCDQLQLENTALREALEKAFAAGRDWVLVGRIIKAALEKLTDPITRDWDTPEEDEAWKHLEQKEGA